MSDHIEEIFGASGHLSTKKEGYKPRSGQIKMARAVSDAMINGQHLMVEGPTGTGKSIAYAAPAVHHVATSTPRPKIAIFTANIALQEQLTKKDLPMLQDALPWRFSFALRKGIGNFVCLENYQKAKADGKLYAYPRGVDQALWQRCFDEVVDAVDQRDDGDKSELATNPPNDLWRLVSTNSDDCLGSKCPSKNSCYYRKAKAVCDQADIVVANYHLLFLHLTTRGEAGSENADGVILPEFDIAICDEVHNAADIAREYFGFKVKRGQVRWLGRSLGSYNPPVETLGSGAGSNARRVAEAMQEEQGKQTRLLSALHDECDRFFSSLESFYRSRRYRARLAVQSPVAWEKLHQTLVSVAESYTRSAGHHNQLKQLSDSDADARARETDKHRCQLLATRASVVANNLRMAMTLDEPGRYVYYLEGNRGRPCDLGAKLIDVAPVLEDVFFSRQTSTILTSATLTVDGNCSYTARDLGVPADHIELEVESPFDFKEQCRLIIPEDMPLPTGATREKYNALVPSVVTDIVRDVDGRALCLFTSVANMNATRDHMMRTFNGEGPRVLHQHDMPRNRLVDEFKADEKSVLLGVKSFWEGVDVQGRALSTVIIDKIPFPTPDDPVLAAVEERNPRGWFFEYSVPRAVIAFKQAFGRLIRSVTDRGLVVVLDPRIVEKNYGRTFLRSLPSVHTTRRLEQALPFLESSLADDER